MLDLNFNMYYKCYKSFAGNHDDSVSREMMPTDLKERLIRLEHENKLLRQNQGSQGDQASVQVIITPPIYVYPYPQC